MKIHFVWPISVNNKMVAMSKMLIKSANGMNAFFTIFVQDTEYNQAKIVFKDLAEIIPYTIEPELAHPWVSTPKWNVEPKGDIVLGLDADLIICNQSILLEYAEKAYQEKTIYGTIAYKHPSIDWKKLFSLYDMQDDFSYRCHDTREPSPYYINNGAVLMPIDLLPIFKVYHRKWLLELNKEYHDLYFISQVATTFAIKDGGLSAKTAPTSFNYLETSNDLSNIENDIAQIAIFHYNGSKEFVPDIQQIKLDWLRNRLTQLHGKLIKNL